MRFADGVLVSAGLVIDNAGEGKFAIGSIFDGFDGCAGFVLQYEGELAFHQVTAGQYLVATEGDFIGLVGRIAVVEYHFLGCNRTVGNLIDHLSGQFAGAPIGDGNDHGVNGIVISHAAQSAVRFADGVLVSAGLVIDNAGEGKFAIGSIFDGFDGCAGFVLQYEGELAFHQVTASQHLVAAEGDFIGGRCLIGIAKDHGSAVLHIGNQLAVAGIGNGDSDGKYAVVIGHTAQSPLNFADGVLISTHSIKGDTCKDDLAVSCILDSLDGCAGFVLQYEGELAFHQVAAGQVLVAGEDDLVSFFCGVGILKFHSAAVVHGGHQLALTVIGNGNGDGKYGIIVGDAAQIARILLDGIGVHAGLCVGDGGEGNGTVGCVGAGGNDLVALHYREGEFACNQVTTGEDFLAFQGDLDGFYGVAVAEHRHRRAQSSVICHIAGTGMVHGNQRVELAAAIVGNLNQHPVDGGIVVNAGDGCGSILTEDIVVVALLAVGKGEVEAEFAGGAVGNHLNGSGVGDPVIFVSFEQLEGEGLVLNSGPIAHQDLHAVHLHIHALGIVGIVDHNATGVITGGSDHQSAIVIMADSDGNGVHGGVVGHAQGGTVGQDLLDIVGVNLGADAGIQVSSGEVQRAEHKAAVCPVGDYLDRLAIGIGIEAEGELTGDDLSAGEGLLAVDDHRAGAGDGVGIDKICAGHRCCLAQLVDHGSGGNQSAIAIIGYSNGDVVFGSVIVQTTGGAGQLCDLKMIGSYLVQQVLTHLEQVTAYRHSIDFAVCIRTGQGLIGIIRSGHLEHEGFPFQGCATHQSLGIRNGGGGRSQGVGVVEHHRSLAAADQRGGCHSGQLTVHSGGNIDVQQIRAAVIGHTGSCGIGDDFLDDVGQVLILGDDDVKGRITQGAGGDHLDGITGGIALCIHGKQAELEAGQRNLHAGVVGQILVNANGNAGAVDLIHIGKGRFHDHAGNGFLIGRIGIGVGGGNIGLGANLHFQDAVHIIIGNHHSEQPIGGGIGHAWGLVVRNLLHNTVEVSAHIGKLQHNGLVVDGLIHSQGADLINLLVGIGVVRQQLLQSKAEHLLIGGSALQILPNGQIQRNIDRIEGAGVSIDEGRNSGLISFDGAGGGSCMVEYKTAGNIGFLHDVGSALGDAQDGDRFFVTQGDGTAIDIGQGAVGIHLHIAVVAGGEGIAGFDLVSSQGDLKGKDLGSQNIGIGAQIVGNILQDGQIAVAVGNVGEFHLAQLDGIGDGRHGDLYGRTGCLVNAVYGDAGNTVIAQNILGNGHIGAGRNTGDVSGHICGHGQPEAAVGKIGNGHTGDGITVGVGDDGIGFHASGDANGEGVVGGIDHAVDLFGQSDAGGRSQLQRAVVAQKCVDIDAQGVIGECGRHEGVAQSAGLVLVLVEAEAAPLQVGRTGRNVPLTQIIALGLGHSLGRHGHIDVCLFGFVVNGSGMLISSTGGLGITGDHLAGGIQHQGILGEVEAAVIQSGVEMGFCHHGGFHFVGVGNAVAVQVITDGPGIGVEGVSAVGILMHMAAVGYMLCNLGFQVDSIQIAAQTNLENQLHGQGVLPSQGFYLVGAIAFQGDIIGNGGDQGRRDLEEHSLMLGLQVGTNLDHHVHHVAVALYAQVAVGLIGVNSALRGIFVAGILIPEANIVAVCIGIPADVVAPVGVVFVVELMIVVSIIDELLSQRGGQPGNPLTNGANQLVATVSSAVHSAQLTDGHTLSDALAGVQNHTALAIAHEDALDLVDFHQFAQFIFEGDVAGNIRITTGDQGVIGIGLQLDLADDLLEGFDHFFGIGCVEILVHIVHARNQSVALNGQAVVAGDDLHIASCYGCQILVPVTGQSGAAAGGIQGIGCSCIGAGAQTQGQKQHVLLIGRIFFVVVDDSATNIGGSQLGQHGDPVIGSCAVTGVGRTHIGIVGGGDGGSAVAHQNDDGYPVRTGLGVALGHDGIGDLLKFLQGLVKTVLDVSTAHDLLGGSGNITASLSLQTGSDLHIHIAGVVSHLLLSGLPVGAAVGAQILIDVTGVGGCIQAQVLGLAVYGNAIVSAQGQHHSSGGGGGGLAGGGIAGVKNNAYAVILVLLHQGINGGIGSIQHSGDIGCIHTVDHGAVLERTIPLIGEHRTGQVQHQHGVGRHGGVAGDGVVTGNGRKCHQEIVGIVQLHAGQQVAFCCKDGFIRPDSTGKFGVHLLRAEELLPVVDGGIICELAAGDDAQVAAGLGFSSEAKDWCQREHHYQAQNGSNHTMEGRILFRCHFSQLLLILKFVKTVNSLFLHCHYLTLCEAGRSPPAHWLVLHTS